MKNLKILLIILIMITVLAGCKSVDKNIKLSKADILKINKNNIFRNKHIIYSEFLPVSNGNKLQKINNNSNRVMDLLINDRGHFRQTVIKMPEDMNGAKAGGVVVFDGKDMYELEPDAKVADVVATPNFIPYQFKEIAEALTKNIAVGKATVKAVKTLNNQKVFHIEMKRYFDKKGQKEVKKGAKNSILVYDQFWINKSNGIIIKQEQRLNGHKYSGYQIEKISVSEVKDGQIKFQLPKGVKLKRDLDV